MIISARKLDIKEDMGVLVDKFRDIKFYPVHF